MNMPKLLSTRTAAVFVLVLAVCSASVFALSKVNFLEKTAMNYAKPMLEKKLNADMASSPFSGNPVTGFRATDVVLSRSGEELVTIKNLKITLSVSDSIYKHTPKLKLEASGIQTSVDKFNRLIPHSDSPEPSSIIISEAVINDSRLDTEFGVLQFDNSSVRIGNSQTYGLDINAKIEDIAVFSLKGGIEKRKGNWTADSLKLRLDDGSAFVDGAVYPVPDAKISAEKLNLSKIAAVFPEVRRFGVRGILTSDLTFKGTGRQLETVGSMSLTNALIHGIPLESLTARWTYGNEMLDAVFNEEKLANSALTGMLKFDGRKGKQSLEADLFTQKLHLATLTEQFKDQLGGIKTLPQGTISGAKVKLKGPLTALTGSIELLPSDINYGGFAFKNLKGSAVFDGKARGKVDFSTLHNGRPLTLTGVLAFADNVQNDLKFSAAGFRLEELYNIIPALKKANVKGAVSTDASLTGTISKLKLNAKLSSEQLTADKLGTISAVRLDGNYLPGSGNLELSSLSAVWNGAKLNTSGTLDNTKQRPVLNFSGHISDFQTERFYPLLSFMDNINLKTSLSADFKAGGSLSDIQADARLTSGAGTLMKGLELHSASAELHYKDNKIIVDPLTLVTSCGVLKSRAESIVKGGTNWSWEADVNRLRMRVINGLFGMHEDIKGIMSGKIKLYSIGQGMHWTGDFKDSAFLWRTFRFDSFTGTANGTKDLVNLDDIKFEICGGKGIAKGQVTIGKTLSTSMLDVNLKTDGINIYEVTRRHLPKVHNIQGLAAGSCKVVGSIAEPVFKGVVKLSPLRVSTAYIPELTAAGEGTLSHIFCKKIRISLPEGSAKGSASLQKTENNWHCKAKLDGSGIDVKKLLRFTSDSVKSMLDGKIDANVEFDCPLNEFMAKGTLTTDVFRIKGLQFEKVKAPFYFADDYFVVEDLACTTNSGTVSGGLAYNTATNRWGATCDVSNLDIEKACKDIFKNSKGKITGKGAMKIRIGGYAFNLGSLMAAGTIQATDGEIAGFKFVDAAKKFTKNKPLRYKKLQTTFRYDNETLIFLPGTQAIAPDGDPVYRVAMADGYITRKGDMSVTCLGKFNIRALNSLLGGISGLMDMSRTITTQGINNIDTKELLQSVLGGVLGGATRSSFRFVSLGLGGNISSPKLTKLVVESDARKKHQGSTIPTSNSDPDERRIRQDGDFTFKLHFEIPVGYGKSSESADLPGQFMQDTLKSLISNITF